MVGVVVRGVGDAAVREEKMRGTRERREVSSMAAVVVKERERASERVRGRGGREGEATPKERQEGTKGALGRRCPATKRASLLAI
jgi:hypothetical protein